MEAKKKAGRPSRFKSLNTDQVRRMFLIGLTDEEICHILKISHTTLWNWCFDEPGFMDSIKGWKDAADVRVEKSLFKKAKGFYQEEEQVFHHQGVISKTTVMKYYPPDTMACMYWLNNRQRLNWKQKPEAEEDESLINNDLEFKDVPVEKDAKHRFSKYINAGQS